MFKLYIHLLVVNSLFIFTVPRHNNENMYFEIIDLGIQTLKSHVGRYNI